MGGGESHRLLVLGASGTLGGPLCLRAEAAGWHVLAAYFSQPERLMAGDPIQMDLRDRGRLARVVEAYRPDAIVHAAVTERSGPGYAAAIRLAGRHVASVAHEVGVRLVALSTDLVFDGTLPLYTEASPLQPASNSEYGHAKADAERDMLALNPAGVIVRTSLIYDFTWENAQAAWMRRALDSGETIRLFTDQMRCPIWAFNLADAVLELVTTTSSGLLHVVGPKLVSRYDLGCALLSALGVDPRAHVVAADAPDTHPKSLNLSIERARSLLQTPLLTLEQARAAAQL